MADVVAVRAADGTAARPAGDRWAEVARLLDRLVEERIFPGGAVAICPGAADEPVVIAVGRLSNEPDSAAVDGYTLYDLASLTKLLGAGAVAMSLDEEGVLELDAPVASLIAGWDDPAKAMVTVGQLLSHSGGLEAHLPLYLNHAGIDAVRTAVKRAPLVYEPGAKSIYSDLGIILLGEVLERIGGRPFGELVHERVLLPLGLRDTMFNPGPQLHARIAPTEDDGWRGRVVRGEVHDENAFAMGGVAPHAGLFSTARDVACFGRSLLPRPRIVARVASPRTIARFTSRPPVPGSVWAYGVRILGGDPLFGSLLSEHAFGLTGFTGTLLAVDPDRDVAIAFLTNRVHPTRENRGIYPARGLVLDAVLRALDGDGER